MSDIFLGSDCVTGTEFTIPPQAFTTHFHLIGGTGKGKTTAIHTMLHPLMRDHRSNAAFFIIDRLGNLSWELLLWMSSKYCPASVRERLLYIEPSREDVVIGFNPLLHDTPQHGYYKVQRATDIILRAWESVDLEKMPRLARWTFNSFWAAAQLGLTIADCSHLLMPGSDYHRAILGRLPPLLQAEWSEIMNAHNSTEAMRILESSRNRLKPYFEAPVLRRMFGATESRLDVLRFMKEGRIVVLNLAPRNRLSSQLGDAIGALILNEVLANARSLPMGIKYPTYLLLDEFQNFVGPDLEAALPEVRQLGIRLILSHQSFSQLERGDYDLTNMIFQAQSRMVFGVQGEDAELLGREFSSLTYDPKRIKDELYSTRQRIEGHEIRELQSWGDSRSDTDTWGKGSSKASSRGEGVYKHHGSPGRDDKSESNDRSQSESESVGGTRANATSHGTSQSFLPIHKDVTELASRTFFAGDEWDRVWAKKVRQLPTGVALVRLVDDPNLYNVAVQRSAVGYLGWEPERLRRKLPQVIEEVERLIEENFRCDLFVSPEIIDRETRERLDAILRPPIVLQSPPRDSAAGGNSDSRSPFGE